MRAGIENWLVEHWYGTSQPPWYLRMLVPIYRAAYLRQQRKGQAPSARYRSKIPLVIVGNLTAGGSGKTPLVIRLTEIALAMNLRPGIASTGYGRKSKDTFLVESTSDTRTCGDEPVLLASRTGVPVVVAAGRLEAVKKLNEMDLDVIFSDDGLQQADLDRDIEFCVVDGERGFGNARLIPAGPLREPVERLSLVDYVVSNGEWADKPNDVSVSVMRLQASSVCSLNGSHVCSIDKFRQNHAGIEIHAVAGIGNPGRFFKMLEELDVDAETHGFSDHHTYTSSDFESINKGSAIIMTEKDAVKCRSLGLQDAWYIPVETILPDELEQAFKDQLVKLVEGNR